MWRSENRPKYNRDKLRYPSDMTDDEWFSVKTPTATGILDKVPSSSSLLCSAINRIVGSEIVHPAVHGLIGRQDPALSQQIFDVAQAQGEPDILPDCVLDDLGGSDIHNI